MATLLSGASTECSKGRTNSFSSCDKRSIGAVTEALEMKRLILSLFIFIISLNHLMGDDQTSETTCHDYYQWQRKYLSHKLDCVWGTGKTGGHCRDFGEATDEDGNALHATMGK